MIAKILFVVIAFSAVAIVALVLIQQSKGDAGSAFGGGGGSQSMFGSRGSANFLSRLTSVLVAVFFLSSIGLAYFYTQQGNGYTTTPVEQEESVLDSLENLDTEVPAVPDTSVPSVPDQSTQTEVPKAELLEPNAPASGDEVPAVPNSN